MMSKDHHRHGDHTQGKKTPIPRCIEIEDKGE